MAVFRKITRLAAAGTQTPLHNLFLTEPLFHRKM